MSDFKRFSMIFSELQFIAKYPISHTTSWQIFLLFFRPTFTYCLTCVPVSGPSYELHSASNIITNSGRLWDPNWKTSLAVLKLKLTQLQKSASKNLEHPTQFEILQNPSATKQKWSVWSSFKQLKTHPIVLFCIVFFKPSVGFQM